jgi:hypothetical protein
MNEEAERLKFEEVISGAPYEKMNLSRYPDEEDRYSWPGGYIVYEVQLAWDIWKERAKVDEQFMNIVDELMMFLWNNITPDGKGGNIDITAAESHASSLAQLMTAVKKHLESRDGTRSRSN